MSETTQQTFLHVGCGHQTKAGTTAAFNTPAWRELRFDINPDVTPDLIGTMTDMSAVGSASVDAIYSSHNIEHLYIHDVPTALAEFLRVLKPAGFLVLTCPDLQSVCELVAQDRLLDVAYESPAGPITPFDMLYGHRPQMAKGNLYMAHKGGFTSKTLMQSLEAAGFVRVCVVRSPESFDLWALAFKCDISDEDLLTLARAHFPLQF